MISVVALLSVSPGPAAARTALSVDYLDCWYIGQGKVSCHAVVSGGTGSYTATWTPVPTTSGWSSPTAAYMTAPCNTDRGTSLVIFKVTDSSGTVTAEGFAAPCTY
jgi:hypothetical protein